MINPTLAATAFNTTGLGALGFASAQMSATWADTRLDADDYDEHAMTLTLGDTSTWRAPVDGYLVWSKLGAPHLSDHQGVPLTGTVAVLRFHPQGALRLKHLVAARHSTEGAHDRPTPFYAAIRDGAAPSGLPNTEPAPPKAFEAGASLETHGRLTFHDERGLIIDPVAVACLMGDLLTALPALQRGGTGDPGDPGSVAETAGIVTGVRLHLVDLFGGKWEDHPDRGGVRIGTGTRLDSGPHDWDGDLELTDTAGPVRITRLPDGALGTAARSVPTLPTTAVPPDSPPPALGRQFFRVAVVDLDLHLTGNRGTEPIDSVPGADEATAAEQAPAIGTGDVELLTNGQHFLGAAREIAELTGTRLLVSPAIADDFPLPAGRSDDWPDVPAPTGTAEALTGEHATRARADATAAYIGDTPDVVVTWPAGALPAESFVRVFPRVDPGRATVPLEQLRFSSRGDGGGAIATAGTECTVRVPDPFQVGEDTRPASPTLVFDLLIVTRESGEVDARLFGSIEVGPVGEGGTAPAETTGPNAFDGITDDHRGLSSAPVLGLAQAEPPPGTPPPDAGDVLMDALGAAAPRESPRFATMARTETVAAGHDDANPGAWTSLIGAGFLTEDSLNGDARLGSPGLPAGPEEHAPGLRVTGSLAQHLARAALRRTHHLATRLVELDDGRWNPATATGGDATGAVLQTVPPTVESLELRGALTQADLEGLPDTWQDLVDDYLGDLPAPLDSLATAIPDPDAGDRLVAEFKREAEAAHYGRRDAQWSWRWALSHARELVYIETSLLSHTAEGITDEDTDKVELVQLLNQRLTDEPNLRVVLVMPRRVPFGPGYEPFAHRMYHGRNQAVQDLTAQHKKRVVAYHPVGFPGRPETLRGTFAVVDDVWALLGGSTLSRRGLTFDGSVDVAFVGHDLRDGVSATVRDARRAAMARVLGVGPRESGSTATPDPRWTQLAGRRSAFELMRRMVQNGGEGEVQPKWPGLEEAETPDLSKAIADPEGKEFSPMLLGLAAALAALGTGRY